MTKIVAKAIKVGKRPLQGTKALVMVATNRSLGESMMRQDVTPAALQPNPIHIVNACLPWAHAFLKKRSRLKAIRGRYPKSSKRVNMGKKIAIGGSITDITQANVRYTPKTRMPWSHPGEPDQTKNSVKRSCSQNNPLASSPEG